MSAEKIEEVTSMYHPCVLISRDRNNSRSIPRCEIDLSKSSRNQKTLFVEVVSHKKSTIIICTRFYYLGTLISVHILKTLLLVINIMTFLQIPRPKAPEILKPDLEWQIEQVAKFTHIRLYISRLLENRSQWPEIQKIYIRQSPEEWKNFFENNEPTLLCILGVDSNLYDLGIDHLTDTFDDIKCGDTIPYKSGTLLL